MAFKIPLIPSSELIIPEDSSLPQRPQKVFSLKISSFSVISGGNYSPYVPLCTCHAVAKDLYQCQLGYIAFEGLLVGVHLSKAFF